MPTTRTHAFLTGRVTRSRYRHLSIRRGARSGGHVTRLGEGEVERSGASWAGKTGPAYFAGYSASKFAVIGLTQALAREMAPHGIRVNAICPGNVIDTAMRTAIEAQQRRYGLPETAEREKSIPIGRVSVPDDVARVAAFLASDESAYMTGESINLSGGLLMD